MPWRAGPVEREVTPMALGEVTVVMPDGHRILLGQPSQDWFICQEHGHYIDSPEHYHLCGDRPDSVVE